MKKLFLLLWIITFTFFSYPITANAISKGFITKYIGKEVEIGFKPGAISLTGLVSKVEQITLLQYDDTEQLCLIQIRYRAGMGREGMAVHFKKYWVSPESIIFPELE